MNATRDFLFDVPVPARTDSYSPVSHRNILEATYEQLDRHSLVVTNEFFNSDRDGRKVIGGLDIIHPDADFLGMRLAFRNSYDKSMSVAFVAGSQVWICSNGAISGEIQYVRKHTGGVVQELNQKIITTVEQLDDHFQKMLRHSEQLHNIEMTKEFVQFCMNVEEINTNANILKNNLTSIEQSEIIIFGRSNWL